MGERYKDLENRLKNLKKRTAIIFKNLNKEEEKKLNDAVGKMLSKKKKNKEAVQFWKKKASARRKNKDIKERLSALNADLEELLGKITDKEKTKLNEIIEQLGKKKKSKKRLGTATMDALSRGRRRRARFNGGRRSRRRSWRRASRRRFR